MLDLVSTALFLIGGASTVGWFVHYIFKVKPSFRRLREDDLDTRLARASILLLLLVLSSLYLAGFITLVQTGFTNTSIQSLISRAIGAVVMSTLFIFYLIVHYRKRGGDENGG